MGMYNTDRRTQRSCASGGLLRVRGHKSKRGSPADASGQAENSGERSRSIPTGERSGPPVYFAAAPETGRGKENNGIVVSEFCGGFAGYGGRRKEKVIAFSAVLRSGSFQIIGPRHEGEAL